MQRDVLNVHDAEHVPEDLLAELVVDRFGQLIRHVRVVQLR